MPINFLSQLTQSGALNVANPMEAYTSALRVKGLQTTIKGAELDQEGKLLTIGSGYLKRVKDRDDYQRYRTYMTDLGANADFLPESFESDGEFENWRLQTLVSADAMLKAKTGQKFKINKVNEDGTTSELEVTKDQLDSLLKAGVIDKEWRLGSVEGTPQKTKERLKMETDIQKDKEIAVAKAKEKPNLKTFYDKDGQPHTIDMNKPSDVAKVKEEWSEDKPTEVEGKVTPSHIQDVKQDYIKQYGSPSTAFERIVLSPSDASSRFIGWLDARDIEEKRGRLSDEDLNEIERAILVDLEIGQELLSNIDFARDQGATNEILKSLIKTYMQEHPDLFPPSEKWQTQQKK